MTPKRGGKNSTQTEVIFVSMWKDREDPGTASFSLAAQLPWLQVGGRQIQLETEKEKWLGDDKVFEKGWGVSVRGKEGGGVNEP